LPTHPETPRPCPRLLPCPTHRLRFNHLVPGQYLDEDELAARYTDMVQHIRQIRPFFGEGYGGLY
ncbi:hypothetical protein, partial [Nocardia sp. NPDC004260]